MQSRLSTHRDTAGSRYGGRSRQCGAGSTQALGARAWRTLHLVGGYYLQFQFMVSFGRRVPDMPLYALFLIPLVAVFALRMIRMATARTLRRVLMG
jgi:hypothetical protein